mgnify:CR=1 FL=1
MPTMNGHPSKSRKRTSSFLIAAGACALGAPLLARAADAGAAAAGGPAALQAQPALQEVIISATPLQDFGLPINEIPSAVQTLSAADLQRQQALDLLLARSGYNGRVSGGNLVLVQEQTSRPQQDSAAHSGAETERPAPNTQDQKIGRASYRERV